MRAADFDEWSAGHHGLVTRAVSNLSEQAWRQASGPAT
jgi:hypothetical protein